MRKIEKFISLIILILLYVSIVGAGLIHYQPKDSEKNPIKITILYDNTAFSNNTKPDWGFACLIEAMEDTILFDTGTKFDILLNNIENLKIDIKCVKKIIISHNHFDHTGALLPFLEKYHDVTLFLPKSVHDSSIKRMVKTGAKKMIVDTPIMISKNIFSTGSMGSAIIEQSLIINSPKGLVIITGCSHQGIVNILKKAKELFKKDIYLVLGGFHLLQHSESDVKNIIQSFKEMDVKNCGATHCTGEKVIKMFQEAYGEQFIKMGTGRVIQIFD